MNLHSFLPLLSSSFPFLVFSSSGLTVIKRKEMTAGRGKEIGNERPGHAITVIYFLMSGVTRGKKRYHRRRTRRSGGNYFLFRAPLPIFFSYGSIITCWLGCALKWKKRFARTRELRSVQATGNRRRKGSTAYLLGL